MPLSVWIIFFGWLVLSMWIAAKADADFAKEYNDAA